MAKLDQMTISIKVKNVREIKKAKKAVDKLSKAILKLNEAAIKANISFTMLSKVGKGEKE